MEEMDLKKKFNNIIDNRDFRNLNQNKKQKLNSIETTISQDQEGNVSKSSTAKATSKLKEPPFIKLYLHDIILLKDLPSSCSSILYELMKLTTWENKIVLNSSIKKDIMAKLEIKTSTLNNTLSQFVKKKILYRLDVGVYMPNPYLFARGEYVDIHQLRLVVDYSVSNESKNIRLEVNGELIGEDEFIEEYEKNEETGEAKVK